MDLSPNHLIEVQRAATRPEVADMKDTPETTNHQRGCSSKNYGIERTASAKLGNTVHLRLAPINKIVFTLDAVVLAAQNKMGWKRAEHEYPSHAAEHLAMCLHCIRSNREKYYCGQMSGVPCHRLMACMLEFCELFFHTSAYGWPSITSILQSTVQLYVNLKDVVAI